MNIQWIAGFINADGSFTMVVSKASKMRLGEKCSIGINIVQHKKSLIVLQCVAELLGCGSINPRIDNTYL